VSNEHKNLDGSFLDRSFVKCVKFNINFVTVYVRIEDDPHNFTF